MATQLLGKETAVRIAQLGASKSYKDDSTRMWKAELDLKASKEAEAEKLRYAYKKVPVIESARQIHARKMKEQKLRNRKKHQSTCPFTMLTIHLFRE